MKNIGIVLLAAGIGKRFGGNKLSAVVDGRPMYQSAIDLVEGYPSVVMVTGNDTIGAAAESRGINIVMNRMPEAGISRSIRLGIEALKLEMFQIDGIMFMVCDQPWLKKATLEHMLNSFEGGILSLSCGGRRGNPVIFSKEYLEELCSLSGDVGGRQVMARHSEHVHFLEVKDGRELQDIDLREQLAKG
jgi:CTP:molybdopterin cytidylyltransferase MocA